MARFAVGLSLCLLVSSFAFAQTSVGIQPFSTQIGGPYDSVDLSSGSITITLPLRNKAGKLPFSLGLVTNSVAYLTTNGQGKTAWGVPTGLRPEPLTTNWGASVNYSTNTHYWCGSSYATLYSGFSVTDETGAYHPFPGTMQVDSLGCIGTQATGVTTDGTGYTLNITSSNPLTYGLYDSSGNKLTHSISGSLVTNTVNDPDGAQLQSVWNTSTEVTTYTDTLGTTALTGPGGSGNAENGSPDKYTYTDASGNTQTIQVNYTQYPLETNFGCTGIAEENLTNLTLYFPTSVVLPDGGTFGISYEATPPGTGIPAGAITGRITTLTLPSGGSITYAYTGGNHGINCSSQVVPSLTRTVNDNNGNNNTWTYVNSNTSSTAGNFTVTETDPAGNQTVHSFAGEYRTQAKYYQGSATGTPLKTVLTCYNGNTSNCATPSGVPSLPITETDVYTSFNGGSSNRVITTYDSTYGNVTATLAYDFGASTLLSQTLFVYGKSYSSPTTCNAYPAGSYVNNTPCYIHTNSGGSDLAETKFAYNNDGKAASVSRWTGATENTWLTTSFGYGANGAAPGVLSSVTDVNNANTSYGNFACNSMLPQTTTLPKISGESFQMSTSQTWNCNGGVVTSNTDVNGSLINTTYADPLYRPTYVARPDGGATAFYYYTGTTVPWTVETSTSESSTQAFNVTTTLDGLGRTVSSQTMDPNYPAGYRNNKIVFNKLGQVQNIYNPYFTTTDKTYGYATYAYDALGRVTQVNEPDGTYSTMSYTNRAEEVVKYPQSLGLTKVYQRDGLGRLTSVCEVTSVTQQGSATYNTPSSCGLDITATGFLTTYTYDSLNNLLTASQAGLSTTRQFGYDGLSRLVAQTNPESNWEDFTYDTGTLGDLYQRVRYAPNQTGTAEVTTTYTHDALHRLTGVSYSDGSTPSVAYNYDQSTAEGMTLSNYKGRLTSAIVGANGGGIARGYDTLGRVSLDWQAANSVNCCFWTYYNYDFLGDLLNGDNMANTGQNYRVNWTNSYNELGQLTEVTTDWLTPTTQGTLVSGITYNALAWIIHEVSSQKRKDALKGMMNTGFAHPASPFGASIA